MKNYFFTWLLRYRAVLVVLLFLFAESVFSNVTLPYILSDNMVLQRDLPVNIWGWADPGEKVMVSFNGQKLSAKASKNGEWKVQLKPMSFGGPYELTIKAKNSIILKNILIGDIWVCGGQSNMERALSQSRNWETDKDNLKNNDIRLFNVPKKVSIKPLDNTMETKWQLCDIESAARFSAVGYYFGKYLNSDIKVPIGLINSNWGGTDIETWISMETMYGDNKYKSTISQMRSFDLDTLKKQAALETKNWQNAINNEDPVTINKWYMPETDIKNWKVIKLPQTMENSGLLDLDGVVWFIKEFSVDASEIGKDAVLSIGPVDDIDETYLNGSLIGRTQRSYDFPRVYKVSADKLKAGVNRIAIKVIDNGGGGGIWGMNEQLFVEINGKKINISGDWHYKVGIDMPVAKNPTSPNGCPSLLYNGMINPLVNFPIKGAIWYQGENNAGNYIKYRSLFPLMIKDWRNKWGIGDFSFLFVQLANYMEPAPSPQESSWAGLREAQTMALSEPNTGMAVIIDIGDAKNIHPANKDDVGKRLELAALKKAYGIDIVYSGPLYKSMKIENDKIIIDFDNIGSGLIAKDKYGYLKSFAIAGSDKKFVWAKAYITSDNKVVVYNESVKNPVAVRYAWANNPDDANFYNIEGLPASPFRTDNW